MVHPLKQLRREIGELDSTVVMSEFMRAVIHWPIALRCRSHRRVGTGNLPPNLEEEAKLSR
jgi:hypothetical protein